MELLPERGLIQEQYFLYATENKRYIEYVMSDTAVERRKVRELNTVQDTK